MQEKINNQIKIDISGLTSAAKEELVAVVKDQETGAELQKITFAGFEAVKGTSTQYYVPITEIAPAYMQRIYTIEIYAGDTAVSTVATYSVESYVRLAIDANNQFAPVSKAALRYGLAVAAYAALFN